MKTHTTKNLSFTIDTDKKSKQAGCNYVEIRVASKDWRVGEQTIKVSHREAKAIRDFLNRQLD